MLFSSIPFLYYFFPAVLIIYFLVPRQAKNAVLFITSLLFYAWGEPKYVILMLAAVLVGYVGGLLIEKFQDSKVRKFILVIAIAVCIAGLGYFKYADFFVENFAAVTHLPVKALGIALPIGISFYTFQIISYLVDVYRGDVAAQKNPIKLGAYVALFAQLIAGPIVRYADIEKQLNDRKHTFPQIMDGIKRFAIGLGKKVLIANVIGELIETFRKASEPSVGFYWLYAVAFALHLYFDFSGYSDMAIGIGKIFGFSFPENFNYPFISGSATEFWRRWHISLGSWFRDYVYIPMGGNRVSKIKWARNILVVWALTGFWHGAEWTYIIWGLLFAALLMIEKAGLGKLLKKCKPVAHIYVAFIILMSFTIFNSGSVAQMVTDLKGLFGGLDIPAWSAQTSYYLRSYAVVLVFAAVGATPLPKMIVQKIWGAKKAEAIKAIIEVIFVLAILIACTAFLVDGSFNPFLYFRF